MLPGIHSKGSYSQTKLTRILYVINFIMSLSSDNMPRSRKDIRQQGG